MARKVGRTSQQRARRARVPRVLADGYLKDCSRPFFKPDLPDYYCAKTAGHYERPSAVSMDSARRVIQRKTDEKANAPRLKLDKTGS